MEIEEIKAFFDERAEGWPLKPLDAQIINWILDEAEIKEDDRVLDAASGRGILFPFYIERGAFVTGVDISSKMCALSRRDFPSVEVINSDLLEFFPSVPYDKIVIFNALPHFPDKRMLFEHLSFCVKKGGRVTIAHDRSRESVNRHHSGCENVSSLLEPASSLSKLFSPWFLADKIRDDEKCYLVSAVYV